MNQHDSADQVTEEPDVEAFFGFGKLWQRCVPATERRPLFELTDDVDLDAGDGAAKRSGYWSLLVLSGVIATCGVVADSVATVIGAMIIAPLATPVLGIGLGLVTGRRRLMWRSLWFVGAGFALIVAMGVVAGLLQPGTISLLENSQISGRTSPGLLDLISALATGLVAAIVRARRDLNDALPGVAIAISLAPPLSVIGVCLAHGSWAFAGGAALLFVGNVVAMMVAATVVFFWVGYPRERYTLDPIERPRPIRRVAIISLAVVALPMLANTGLTAMRAVWVGQIDEAARQWLQGSDDATVDDISWEGNRIEISVRSPQDLPDVAPLERQIADIVPIDQNVSVIHTVGDRID